VMITDSKVSSHPIIVNVQNPNQINEVFDRISYSKVGIRVEIIS
jgi:aminopeptidase N